MAGAEALKGICKREYLDVKEGKGPLSEKAANRAAHLVSPGKIPRGSYGALLAA